MNMDTGHIKYWNELTDEEKESGRWVKLGDNELAIAQTIDEHKRHEMLNEIFGAVPETRFPDYTKGQK